MVFIIIHDGSCKKNNTSEINDTKGELDEDFLDEVCNNDRNTAITSDL
jgi:hypothetical protein